MHEVVAQDLAKGATTAQFDFVTAITGDLEGVWTVNGKEYSFDELALVADIVAASQPTVNQVKLFNLLTDAGIEDLNADFIGVYATTIAGANPAPVWLTDVQELINEVNEDNADAAAEADVVKAVVDATNQIQLLKALQDNGFERVNADWIADYAGEDITAVTGTNMLDLAGPENYFGTAATGVTKQDIQDAIDAANATAITTADTAADTAAKQAAVTALIQKWVEADDADTPNNTPKADAIEDSEINRLGFVVAEATTENSLYNALVAYANATPDATLKASELNANLKSFYLAEMNAGNNTKRNAAVAGFTGASNTATYDYKTNIVQVANLVAKNAAMADIVAKYTAYNTTDNAQNKAAFKASLQKLADVTSHETAANNKFLMSTINDDSLKAYATAFAAATAINGTDTVANVQAKVAGVNGTADVNKHLATIVDENATTTQVRDALT